MEEPREIEISFLLPMFNVEHYLDDCIGSITQQMSITELEYEIIIIDDASTDDSYKVTRELQYKNDKIKLYRNNRNRGISYTRNMLMEKALGKYIWFVDPDDILLPIVEIYHNVAEKENADFVYGDFKEIPQDYNYYYVEKDEKDQRYFVIDNLLQKLPKNERGRRMNAVWSGIFLRHFLIKENIKFNEKMFSLEDVLFFYDVSLKSKKIIKLNKLSYLYRQRFNSALHTHSSDNALKNYTSMYELLNGYIQRYNDNQYNDKEYLENEIVSSKQKVTIALASINDDKYMKEQMCIIQDSGIYPYKFRIATLKDGTISMVRRWIYFFLPIKPVFYLLHFAYKISYLKQSNNQ